MVKTVSTKREPRPELTGYVTPANIEGKLYLVETDKPGKHSFKQGQGKEAFAFLSKTLADNPELKNNAFGLAWGRDGVPFEDAVYHLHISRYQNLKSDGFVQCYLTIHGPNRGKGKKEKAARRVVFL